MITLTALSLGCAVWLFSLETDSAMAFLDPEVELVDPEEQQNEKMELDRGE